MRTTLILVCIVARLGLALAQASSGAVAAGDHLLRAGKFKEAVQQYSVGVEVDPNNHVPLFKRASVHQVLGDKQAALKDLDGVIKIKPTLKQAREKRADILMAKGHLDRAAEDLQVVSANGGDAAAVGRKLSEMQQARAHLDQAKAKHAGDPDFSRGFAPQIKKHAEEALKTCTESIELLTLSSRASLHMGQSEQVIVDTGRLIKLDRGNIDALAIRAEAYYKIGELESALKHLREGLRHDPEHKYSQKIYKKLRKLERKVKNANGDWESQQWEDAATGFKGAIKEDPDHKVHRVAFGLKICEAYKNLKQGASGIEACNGVLEVEGSNVEALLLRAECKKLEEDFQGSLNDLQEAKKHREGDRGIDQKIHEAQKVLEQSKKKNYYKILKVRRSADAKEIKRSYRKLALKYHPDKIKDESEKKKAETIFRDIAEAYGVLSNAELRGKYDRGEDVSGQAQQQQQGGFGFPGGQQFHFHFRL